MLLGWWAQRPLSLPWSDAKGPYVWRKSSRPLNLFRKLPLPAGFRGDPEAALLQPGCGERASLTVLVLGSKLRAEGSSVHCLGPGSASFVRAEAGPWRRGRGEHRPALGGSRPPAPHLTAACGGGPLSASPPLSASAPVVSFSCPPVLFVWEHFSPLSVLPPSSILSVSVSSRPHFPWLWSLPAPVSP